MRLSLGTRMTLNFHNPFCFKPQFYKALVLQWLFRGMFCGINVREYADFDGNQWSKALVLVGM